MLSTTTIVPSLKTTFTVSEVMVVMYIMVLLSHCSLKTTTSRLVILSPSCQKLSRILIPSCRRWSASEVAAVEVVVAVVAVAATDGVAVVVDTVEATVVVTLDLTTPLLVAETNHRLGGSSERSWKKKKRNVYNNEEGYLFFKR